MQLNIQLPESPETLDQVEESRNLKPEIAQHSII